MARAITSRRILVNITKINAHVGHVGYWYGLRPGILVWPTRPSKLVSIKHRFADQNNPLYSRRQEILGLKSCNFSGKINLFFSHRKSSEIDALASARPLCVLIAAEPCRHTNSHNWSRFTHVFRFGMRPVSGVPATWHTGMATPGPILARAGPPSLMKP